jgi:hypothetical protein
MGATTHENMSALWDRFAIKRVIGAYARGVDRNDAELMRSAFHPDARVSKSLQTVDQYVAGIQAGWQRFRAQAMHCTMNQTIDIDGDTAHAETYYLAIISLKSGCEPPQYLPADAGNDPTKLWFIGGRYCDRLEKRDSEWRIAFRMGTMEALMPGDGSPTKSMLQLVGDIARQDRSDPSYERLLSR